MNLLLVTILLPLVGAAAIWTWGEEGRGQSRVVALVISVLTLVLAGRIVFFPDDALSLEIDWLSSGASGLDVRLSLGLDGLSVWLFGLSALLTVVSVLVSWEAIRERASAFYGLLLLLETGMLGVFAARDIILFYVFFEFTLIPLFFLIGIWGSEERRYAAMKFFLFTLAGSVLTFLGLLAIVLWVYYHPGAGGPTGVLTFSIEQLRLSLADAPIEPALQMWIFVALFAGFAIKVPLFPLHTWLPLAHVQAPTAGSVILAGVLLKIGIYGFLRFSIPMLPDAAVACMPWMLWLAAAGIIYGALVALAQSDIKRLIAYSSVSHLGFCMLGLFALNGPGLEGGVLQTINHGLSTGGLFALVGMIYERYHTRRIKDLSGIARRTPWLAMFMLLMTFSSIGLPGLNGFAGEFLLLLGMFQRAWSEPAGFELQYKTIAVLAVLGVVLGAWYMLWLLQRVFFGPLREPKQDASHPPVRDMNLHEGAAMGLITVFVFWIGLQPSFFLDRIRPAVTELAAPAVAALAARNQDRADETDPASLASRRNEQGESPSAD